MYIYKMPQLPTLLIPGKIKLRPDMSPADIEYYNKVTPIDHVLSWFDKRIPRMRGMTPMIRPQSIADRVMLLKSDTGSGKSITLAPALYNKFFELTRRDIAVTQMRILTAIELTDDIVKIYPNMKLGENIGYQTGDYVFRADRGITFMTIGILTQHLNTLSDEAFIDKYAFIVVDECHSREIGMDMIIYLSKKFLQRNYKNIDCPFFIFTSATFDTDKYARYFEVDKKSIIEVSGFNYPITAHYATSDISNYVANITNTIAEIQKIKPEGNSNDVLIFIYSAPASRRLIKSLKTLNDSLADNFMLIELSGASYFEGDDMVHEIHKRMGNITMDVRGESKLPTRRVIVATNIAETGITIDTLKYVIDSGYESMPIFNPIYGATIFITKAISQASALQRKGRVGRRYAGDWYPMYTVDTFNKFQKEKYPDIFTADITEFMLGIIIRIVYPKWDKTITGLVPLPFDIESLDLLDNPSTDSILYSIEKLYILGLIDHKYVPTPIGLTISKFTHVPIEALRMLMAGYQHKARIADLIVIASFMTIQRTDYLTDGNALHAREIGRHAVFDDFIEPVFIWESFMTQLESISETFTLNDIIEWCVARGYNYNALLSVVGIRDSLISTCIQSAGIDPFDGNPMQLSKVFDRDRYSGMLEIQKLKKCIYEGYRLNTATLYGDKYILDITHQPITIASSIVGSIADPRALQTKPIKIVVDSIVLKQTRTRPIRYVFRSNRVSIMDGFVNVDETFIAS